MGKNLDQHADADARRRAVEEEFRAREALLSFGLQTIHTGAWDLNLLEQTAHRTLIHDQIFGYETLLPQWTYEMFLEHVLPEDRPEVDRRFRAAIGAHAGWNFECRIRRADGEVRWILAAGDHQHNLEGNPMRMAGIVQDITERKQAEAVLESRLRISEYALGHSLDEIPEFQAKNTHYNVLIGRRR